MGEKPSADIEMESGTGLVRLGTQVVVLRCDTVDVDGVAQALGNERVEVVNDSDELLASVKAAGGQGGALVVAPADQFLSMERRLLSDQSTLLLNSIGEGVCLTDRRGGVMWSNDAFRAFHVVLHRRIGEIVSQAVTYFDTFLEHRSPGVAIHPKRYNFSLKQSQRFFECVVTAVIGKRDGREQLEQLAFVLREVTARRRMESQVDALNKSGRELIRFDEETIRSKNAAERLGMLEEKVVSLAHDLLHFDNFAVRVRDTVTNELKLVMSVGLPAEATEIQLYAETEGQGISGYVGAVGRSYICPDASSDSRYIFGLEQAGSSLTVPLKLFDRIIGVLNVESDQVAAFSDQDRQFAEIFASYLAMALHLLNLLLVERTETHKTATGTLEGELERPIETLISDIDRLQSLAGESEAVSEHTATLLGDVDRIKTRLQSMAKGPQTILGTDRVSGSGIDPVIKEKRVLVVDDEASIRDTVQELLSEAGAAVTVRKSGRTALDTLKRWYEDPLHTPGFDLVLSDINLDDDVTGYQVFSAAKRASADVPVILMTGFGYDPHHSIVKASGEGLQAVLFKPFDAGMLLDECKKAFGVSESSAD